MHKKNKMAQPISIMSFFSALHFCLYPVFFFCLLWNPVPFFFFCLWASQFWNGLDTLILSLHPVRKMAQWCEHSPHEPCGCCMHVLSVVPVWAEADSWTRGGINYIVTYSWPGWPSHNAGGCEASGCYLPGATEWVSVGHEMRMVKTAQRVDLVNDVWLNWTQNLRKNGFVLCFAPVCWNSLPLDSPPSLLLHLWRVPRQVKCESNIQSGSV